MSRKKKPLVFEDLSYMSDKWTSGMSGKQFTRQYMTLLDILNSAGENQHPNNAKAPGTPIHGSQMFIEMLGEVIGNVDEFHKALKTVSDSPVLKGDTEAHAKLNKMAKKAAMIKKLTMSISEDIEQFEVEVSQ